MTLKDRLKGIGLDFKPSMLEDRRLLLGVGVICVLTLLLVLRSGYFYHQGTEEKLSAYDDMLLVSSQVLTKGGEIQKEIGAGAKRLAELENGLLRADKPSIGAAKLQEAVKQIASKRMITIESEKALNVKEVGEYIKIPVEFHFKTELKQLNMLLYDIEESQLLIGVRDMHIKTSDRNNPFTLNITIVVEGVIKKVRG